MVFSPCLAFIYDFIIIPGGAFANKGNDRSQNLSFCASLELPKLLLCGKSFIVADIHDLDGTDGISSKHTVSHGQSLQHSAEHSHCKSISRAFIDWSVGAQENLAPLLKQSPVPQLWIAGQRDARFSALARRMAGGQAVIIPHAGHRLPLETPERLAECLQPFILQNL